eukprot:1929049-Alexandrium_andersonii.AAC.1
MLYTSRSYRSTRREEPVHACCSRTSRIAYLLALDVWRFARFRLSTQWYYCNSARVSTPPERSAGNCGKL